MTLTILFWVLMLLWLLFGGYWSWAEKTTRGLGTWLIPFLVILILGWKVFGAPVQGG